MIFKKHQQSGAFSVHATQEEKEIGNLSDQNKQLTEENQLLKSKLDSLTELLLSKGVISEDELKEDSSTKESK